MADGSRLEKYTSLLPVSWEKLVGEAVSFYLTRHDPEKVVMEIHTDENDNVFGYSIKIKTDKNSVQEAYEFWEEHIEPKL